MPMAVVMIAILVSLALDPNLAKQIGSALKQINSGLVSGVTGPVTNAWIEVAIIAAGLGFAIWLIETKVAKGMGQEVAAPPVSAIGVAAPPSFGGAGGLGVNAGPLQASTSVSAQSGSFSNAGQGTPGRPISAKKAAAPKKVAKQSAFGR